MKEKKTSTEEINHYRKYLKILVFTRSCLQITGIVSGIIMIAVPASSFLFWIGFHILGFAAVLLVSLLPLVSAVRANLHSSEALQATCEYCDADDALDRWRMQHWLVNWDSPEAKELIRKRIEARTRFLNTHPFIKDEESPVRLQVLPH